LNDEKGGETMGSKRVTEESPGRSESFCSKKAENFVAIRKEASAVFGSSKEER